MFSVVRRIFGSTAADDQSTSATTIDLISLPAGRLNLIRSKHSSKVDKECIYLDAQLILRRTSMPFHYQLVVARLDEDDQDPSESEDALEDEHEKAFLLAEALDLRVYETVDESDDEERITIGFSWLDLSSSELFERFEFVVSSQHEDCSRSEIDRVEDAIVQCIWEGENEKDSSEASEEELQAIKQKFGLPQPQSDITYPALPSHGIRAPSATLSSDDSDNEEAADTTLDFSQTSRRSRPLSQQQSDDSGDVENLLVEKQQDVEVDDDDDSDSDSSDNDIVNQLKGVTLTDNHHHKDQSTSSTTHPVSPVKKAKSPPASAKRVAHPSIVRAPSPTPSSHSQESTDEVEEEINQEEEETHTDSSSRTDGQEDEDPEAVQSTGDDDQLTVTAWSSTCDLYLFQPATTSFEKTELGIVAELWVSAPDNPKTDVCWLTVTRKIPGKEDFVVISTTIEEDQNLTFGSASIMFRYNYPIPGTDGAQACTWALRFRNDEVSRAQYTAAQEAFAKALYDRDHGLGSYEAQDRANKEWSRLTYGVPVEGGYDDDEDDNNEDENAEEGEAEEEEEDYASSDDDEEDEQLRRFRSAQSGPKNSCLATGLKENVSCVLRGPMIGIFKNESTSDKKLKFMATIPDLTTPDGSRTLRPDKIMLHYQDRRLIVTDRDNPTSLYECDVERGKIIHEIPTGEIVKNYFPLTKSSQLDAQHQFIGTSRDSFYKIDPRQKDAIKIVAEAIKKYKTKMDFTCGATTDSGEVALASGDGKLRLFDEKIGKIAKTLLPEGRDPIYHADVTNNGRYVVATCEKYLLLYDCQMSNGQSGFTKSFPKTEKPHGIRIELTHEHRAQILHENIPFRFEKAKFNRGDGDVERKILAYIGPYVIIFDLKSILDKNKKTQYTVKRYQQQIVDDNFRYNDDKDIVVTLESDVIMEKRARLAKPTRASIIGIGGPIDHNQNRQSTRGIRTGSSTLGIVQEWED
ncbi:hypothetical protein MJO28_005955 [Puccinia striiformis f. sp. tritici]|uniref:Uncharacterized protein n=1 Tax=Puccinia striiformis f. sp. tritici TaxID=168172 RepID=A0ACC0EG18_9BASI|nr:hypothetical protein Pst134EB_012169 [Puccinia striiformis f. sp. tritici]KAI7953408.1 hypothetical protein MJO28_005955 [Puccinia striiformis f. sp. tritici]